MALIFMSFGEYTRVSPSERHGRRVRDVATHPDPSIIVCVWSYNEGESVRRSDRELCELQQPLRGFFVDDLHQSSDCSTGLCSRRILKSLQLSPSECESSSVA